MGTTATREAYGDALCELGADENLYVFDADLSICTMTCDFKDKYPERFFNIGIAEANMVGIGAGAAATGKTAVVNSFAMFMAGRCYDQIRNSVCYPNLNVKCVGTHAGLSVGEDGPTHQCIEDLGLMRVIPNMTVICPCDANETKAAVKAMLKHNGPCYLRLGRSAVEDVTADIPGYNFELGKGCLLKDGTDATIIATGLMVQEALVAAKALKEDGLNVAVVDIHTIKPLDEDLIIAMAKKTGAIVTAEEHNVLCGLGSAVSELLGENFPVPVLKVGVMDTFGHSGAPRELMEKYGITDKEIVEKVKLAVSKKA